MSNAEESQSYSSLLNKKIRNYINEGNLRNEVGTSKQIFDDVPCEYAEMAVEQQPTYNDIKLSAVQSHVGCIAHPKDDGTYRCRAMCHIMADWEKK